MVGRKKRCTLITNYGISAAWRLRQQKHSGTWQPKSASSSQPSLAGSPGELFHGKKICYDWPKPSVKRQKKRCFTYDSGARRPKKNLRKNLFSYLNDNNLCYTKYMTTTYRLIDVVRDLLTGEETRIVLAAGLAKPAAKRELALRRAGNVLGPEAIRTGRSSVVCLEVEA